MQTLVARARVEALAGRTDAATASCVAALRAAAHSAEFVDSIVGGIALAVVYGADAHVLEDAVRALRFDVAGGAGGATPATQGIVLAVRGLRSGDEAALLRASRILRGPRIGSLRAELRAIGAWIEAESAQIRGDGSARITAVAQALAESRLLGHRWLEERARLLRGPDAPTAVG
jgi:hypothetical protein